MKRRGSKGTGNGGRAPGQKNYSARELDQLLNIVEDVEPVGSNMWNQVWEMYKEWADTYGYPIRDVASVKQNFDRLAAEKKPTVDANCPVRVRRAKRAARAILAKVQAVTLKGRSDSDNDDECTFDGARSNTRIGIRANKRRPGSTGIRSGGAATKSHETLVACVSQVAQKFAEMSDAYTRHASMNFEGVIREEVKKAVSESITELKALFKSTRG